MFAILNMLVSLKLKKIGNVMTRKIKQIKMYPESRILYKTDNSEGWYMAHMGVAPEEAKKYCEEQKAKGIWFDYKCYLSAEWAFPISPDFIKGSPSADDMHMTSSLIYNSYEGKWYSPNEIMPAPKINLKLCKEFCIDITPADLSKDGMDLEEKDDYNNIEAFVRFLPCQTKFYIQMDILRVAQFIKKLKKYGYAELTVEEYDYCKLLAWKIDENILFILQNYGGNDIKESLKILVPEAVFYGEFIKLDVTIKYLTARIKRLYAEFQATELFLHGLRWEYDAQKPEKPQEYTLLSWNPESKNKLKKLIKKIEKEYSYDHTRHLGRYKYWYDSSEERLSRTYAYQHEEDLVRFVTSKDFKYQKGMHLRDVYAQLLSCGYQWRMKGKWKGNEINIYANGDVIVKKDGSHISELETLLRKIVREAHKRATLPAGQLFDLLLDVGFDGLSYFDRQMNIKNL